MSKDIFISYSRRDQEFVSRLASDLNAHVAFVWFDRSTIQPGQKWHDEILEGIRECKAFILVLSPDAVESRYVREELNKALELGKPIFPVIYRPAKWTDEFASLIKDIQTIDFRSGSYTDNFHKLVDGLAEAGAIKTTTYERPFLREPTKTSMNIVFRKALSWAFAWSLGWLFFWAMTFSLSGMTGGFIGGFVAGLLSMFALRPYAPSISWKHISPTIRVWAVSGPTGMIISGIITVVMLIIGIINAQNELPRCPGIVFAECLRQIFFSAYREPLGTILLIVAVFVLFLILVWFLTGLFTGWLVVRHVRKLEPGITSKEGWNVSTGWGCGAIVAAIVTMLIITIIAKTLGL